MNVYTGELRQMTAEELDKLSKMEDNPWLQINQNDITRKQKRERKVSLNDHRSKLGKQRLTAIQERKGVFGR